MRGDSHHPRKRIRGPSLRRAQSAPASRHDRACSARYPRPPGSPPRGTVATSCPLPGVTAAREGTGRIKAAGRWRPTTGAGRSVSGTDPDRRAGESSPPAAVKVPHPSDPGPPRGSHPPTHPHVRVNTKGGRRTPTNGNSSHPTLSPRKKEYRQKWPPTLKYRFRILFRPLRKVNK